MVTDIKMLKIYNFILCLIAKTTMMSERIPHKDASGFERNLSVFSHETKF